MKDRRCPRNLFPPLTEQPRPPAHRRVVYTQEVVFPVGTWLSLVEHSLGVRGVGSSNLPVPTIHLISRNQPVSHLWHKGKRVPKMRAGIALDRDHVPPNPEKGDSGS